MVTVDPHPPAASASPRVLKTVDEALEYVHAICFKTGPPGRGGVELEWTLHHRDDPTRLLDLPTIRTVLGAHAQSSLDPGSLHEPLPHGGKVTVEPGGQVEVSTPPYDSLARLIRAITAEIAYLTGRLAATDLRLGEHGIDPYRPPRRLLNTPRYDAMAAAFARPGFGGLTMMCGTTATQVCLDAGEPEQLADRWQTVQALGPVLLALFATANRHAGRDTGWASARMRAWLEIDSARTAEVSGGAAPATTWALYALAAPLLYLRRRGANWCPPLDDDPSWRSVP